MSSSCRPRSCSPAFVLWAHCSPSCQLRRRCRTFQYQVQGQLGESKIDLLKCRPSRAALGNYQPFQPRPPGQQSNMREYYFYCLLRYSSFSGWFCWLTAVLVGERWRGLEPVTAVRCVQPCRTAVVCGTVCSGELQWDVTAAVSGDQARHGNSPLQQKQETPPGPPDNPVRSALPAAPHGMIRRLSSHESGRRGCSPPALSRLRPAASAVHHAGHCTHNKHLNIIYLWLHLVYKINHWYGTYKSVQHIQRPVIFLLVTRPMNHNLFFVILFYSHKQTRPGRPGR